jgi:hypothetical protein
VSERIQTRIRKLFALAKDQEGTYEGTAAAQLARKLLLEQAQATLGMGPEARDRVDPFLRRGVDLGGTKMWRCKLITLMARHCECVAGYSPGAGTGSLYGRTSAVVLAEHLFLVHSRQLTMERAVKLVELDGQPQAFIDRAMNDFTQSALLALEVRLGDSRDDEKAASPESFALVRSAKSGLREWMQDQGYALRKEVPFPYGYDIAGYQAGYRLPLQDAVEG